MNTLSIKKLNLFWTNYFYISYTPQDFSIFRPIIFLYIFFAVGISDIKSNEALENLWNPISFFNLWSYSIWTIISEYSYYLLKFFSLLCALNVFYKYSSKFCFFALLFNLGFYSNFGKVFHGYQLLIMTIALLSLVHNPNSTTGLWPLQLLKIYASSVYFMAGINKMATSGLEWVFSHNLYRTIVHTPGKTELAKIILKLNPNYSISLAFFVVFFLQLPAIFAPFTRFGGIYLFTIALLFHLGVHFTFGGHFAFLSQIFCLLIFLPLRDLWDFTLFEFKRHF